MAKTKRNTVQMVSLLLTFAGLMQENLPASHAQSLSSGPRQTLIFRQDPATGKRQEIDVDLDAVISGKQRDIPVLPNDIIIIPNAPAKSWRFPDAPPIRLFSPCRG